MWCINRWYFTVRYQHWALCWGKKVKEALMLKKMFLSFTVTLLCVSLTCRQPPPFRAPCRRMGIVKLYTLWPWISFCKICNQKENKNVAGGMWNVQSLAGHCGGWRETPTACEEAKRKVLLFGCAPRPGTDISTLILTLPAQRPQS